MKTLARTTKSGFKTITRDLRNIKRLSKKKLICKKVFEEPGGVNVNREESRRILKNLATS